MMSPYVFAGLLSKDNKLYNEKKLKNSLLILTSRIFEISEDKIMSNKRTRLYVQARTVISAILRYKYNMSLINIGYVLDKHHSTIINMLKNHKIDLEYDEVYRKKSIQIERLHTC